MQIPLHVRFEDEEQKGGSHDNERPSVTRNTKETQISLKLRLDGSGKSSLDTGVGFFDHMLDGFSRHGLFDLNVKVKGDLQVDDHHTIEDTGIVLGTAIKEAVGDKKGIRRLRKLHSSHGRVLGALRR